MLPEGGCAMVPDGRRADSSGTPEIDFIILKSLQNLRICHVPMELANGTSAVLYTPSGFQSAAVIGTMSVAGIVA
jgi:hypothetical protein